MSKRTLCLTGNPNCGKTTLFNDLTGANQRVGNWPGVTVERKEGAFQVEDWQITLVDLPGIYSLDALDEQTGLDETVARDYLLSNEVDLVVNIVDASNLERNLYLTAQIMEMRLPMVVVLNMPDVARARGLRHLRDQRGPVRPETARCTATNAGSRPTVQSTGFGGQFPFAG